MNTSIKAIFILMIFTSLMCRHPEPLISSRSQQQLTILGSEELAGFYLLHVEHTNATIPGYKYYKLHIIPDSVLSQSFYRTETLSSSLDSFSIQFFRKRDSYFFRVIELPNTLENALCFDFSSEHNIINYEIFKTYGSEKQDSILMKYEKKENIIRLKLNQLTDNLKYTHGYDNFRFKFYRIIGDYSVCTALFANPLQEYFFIEKINSIRPPTQAEINNLRKFFGLGSKLRKEK